MVRLVFRPYTHVRRTICTSVSLRASIRVSPDFALHKHSSPSFGSRHGCSCEAPFRRNNALPVVLPACLNTGGGRTLTRFLSAPGFATRALAHMSDSLVRVSRRVGSVRNTAGSWSCTLRPSDMAGRLGDLQRRVDIGLDPGPVG